MIRAGGSPMGVVERALASPRGDVRAVVALPCGITRGRFAIGRLTAEAQAQGVPGRYSGPGGCHWRGHVRGQQC
jgi:hypothetical protein